MFCFFILILILKVKTEKMDTFQREWMGDQGDVESDNYCG